VVVVAQPEGGDAADRHRRDHAERAERDARRPQRVALVERALAAVGEHELHARQLAAEVREARTRAVRAGRERPGERLRVDVAEVGHRESARVQLA
jgi:hypothetical protein